jgi:hypothetical protein
MKKLRIEDLQVESFQTVTAQQELRGTVHPHQEPCTGARTGCGSNEGSYDILTCPGTASDDGFCGGGTGAESGCCHPYGPSLDWTFCETECCNDSNVQTCQNWGCV